MSENTVKIKNLSNTEVTVILPNVRFRREWAPGMTANLPADVYEEFCFDPGCIAFVRDGFLKVIVDKEEIQEKMNISDEIIESEEVNIEKLLTTGTSTELADFLKNAPAALKDKVVDEALRLSIAESSKCRVIKLYTGADIIQALSLQRE